MTKLRVAVAGMGIGRQHVAAFRQLPEQFDVVALCDPNAERRNAVASEFGIPGTAATFDDLLVRDDVDVVDICTPQNLHFLQVKAALAAGRHVICEKPVVGSLADCDALIDAERASGAQVMPVYQYRFGVGLQKLLHLIDRGVTGRHYLSTAETTWRRGPAYFETAWRGKLAQAMGGCLLTHAIHAHDALTLALGGVRKVYATIATRVNAVETEDCAVASLTLTDGSLASLAVTLGSADDTSRLRFHFEHLTAQSSLAPYTMTAEPWTLLPANESGRPESPKRSRISSRARGIRRPVPALPRCMDPWRELPVTLRDARTSLELLTALYYSAATGIEVELAR
jgi:predicted dehydrogenase